MAKFPNYSGKMQLTTSLSAHINQQSAPDTYSNLLNLLIAPIH